MQVRLERIRDVVELTWAAPGLNLFTDEVAEEFEQALRDVPADARALLLRAEGKVFCGGVKVQGFVGMDSVAGAAFSRRCLALVGLLESVPVPTVVAVHGLNLTIGLELALGCDFIWAAENVEMGLVEAKVGLTPAGGGTQRLVARAGIAHATEMVMIGGTYDAETLCRWGVVDRVLPSAELMPEARAFAARLAAGPTAALAAGKRILRAARDAGVRAADDITPEVAGAVMATKDAAIGVEAVLAGSRQTAPDFGGN